MALKPDRIEHLTDISFFMNSVAERGGVACYTNGGVGAAMDDSDAVVGYISVGASGVPAGVLLNDVVNYDLTRQHINWHRDEVQLGGKVTLLRIGQVTTDRIDGTPLAGDSAYVGDDGDISTSAAGLKIGTFLSAKDSDGFAKVAVNIQ